MKRHTKITCKRSPGVQTRLCTVIQAHHDVQPKQLQLFNSNKIGKIKEQPIHGPWP